MTQKHAIVTRGLTKSYGGRAVVNRLDLKVPVGCVYGLLGRNGTGKSTTIKMLTGMVQPDAGEAEILGEPVSTMSAGVRERIAYVAEGHPLYRLMTIKQHEDFQRAFYPRWDHDLFLQILDHFQLSPKKRVWWLSRGQRAQVALALAVAPDPELLILDDPTLGLDTVVRRDFLESMIQIIQHEGRTILFSSHVLGDVERVADRIGIIVDGVLRVDCPTDHFKQAVKKVVLTFEGTPQPWPGGAGVVSDRTAGNRREMVIANFGDEHRSAIDTLGAKVVEVLEMNLEDAFVEYTRGARKSLPDFTRRERQPATSRAE
ncbi:MAG: ABC transporter ATP-binding protein [Planctomycetaceae bacterium]